MLQFPPQLIQRLQTHFAQKYHKQLSIEEACEYLDAWADLYLTVVGWERQAGQPAGGGVRPP